jgi:hypothetical protein
LVQIGDHLSTYYISFLSLCILSFIFSNLDFCSWIIIWFCITTFQCIPLTYYPTKLHLKHRELLHRRRCYNHSSLQIAAPVLALFRERKNLFCKW